MNTASNANQCGGLLVPLQQQHELESLGIAFPSPRTPPPTLPLAIVEAESTVS